MFRLLEIFLTPGPCASVTEKEMTPNSCFCFAYLLLQLFCTRIKSPRYKVRSRQAKDIYPQCPLIVVLVVGFIRCFISFLKGTTQRSFIPRFILRLSRLLICALIPLNSSFLSCTPSLSIIDAGRIRRGGALTGRESLL